MTDVGSTRLEQQILARCYMETYVKQHSSFQLSIYEKTLKEDFKNLNLSPMEVKDFSKFLASYDDFTLPEHEQWVRKLGVLGNSDFYDLMNSLQELYYIKLPSKCISKHELFSNGRLLNREVRLLDYYHPNFKKCRRYKLPYCKNKFLNDICYICLQEFVERTIVLELNCRHAFHFDCVKIWFWSQFRTICPTCRAKQTMISINVFGAIAILSDDDENLHLRINNPRDLFSLRGRKTGSTQFHTLITCSKIILVEYAGINL
ncbi:hypothetical protein HELRODRAFT_192043 [Helobdella robusta]|uniref:RING-type domain-containing protein n=1 Tax=Helobdella robusta TaxID=6412 RepID=T1FTJ3_HELRO|nr:hypothetical protein HELRODRAFT_192043 [Helobdella robusta]ESO03452.1 hypothetical protein HELRODRAFT_192043 [Helobdella robusta]